MGSARPRDEPQDMERRLRTSGHGSARPRDEPQDMERTSGCGKTIDGYGSARSSDDPQDMERTWGHGSARPRDEPQDIEQSPKTFGRQGGVFGIGETQINQETHQRPSDMRHNSHH